MEIISPASSGGQGNYKKYVSFLWPPLQVAPSISYFYPSLLNSNFFEKELTITQATAKCRMISLLKCLSWNDLFGSSDHGGANKPYLINVYHNYAVNW